MTYYLAGRTSSQNPDMQHSQYITAGSPANAARIARRLLTFARKHSEAGEAWDRWYVAKASTRNGNFLVYQQGGAD